MKKLFIILLLIPILSSAQRKEVNSIGFEEIWFGDCVYYSYDGNPFNDNEETLSLYFKRGKTMMGYNIRGNKINIICTKSDISPLKIDVSYANGPKNSKFTVIEFIFDNDKSTYFKLTQSRTKIKSLDDELFLKFKKHKNVIVRMTWLDDNGRAVTEIGSNRPKIEENFFNLRGMTAGFNKFSGVKAPSIKNKNSYAVANGLANVNPFNLEKYIDKFILDAKINHNIDLSYVNKRDRLIIFRELKEKTIAIAYKMNNDNEVFVKVDPENWYAANQSKRWYIIYHELGHDILNLEHGECGAMMNATTSGSYTWDRLEKDKNTMFESYKLKVK
mgnify:CR=1 FL=1